LRSFFVSKVAVEASSLEPFPIFADVSRDI
jgi:hypothetical protein